MIIDAETAPPLAPETEKPDPVEAEQPEPEAERPVAPATDTAPTAPTDTSGWIPPPLMIRAFGAHCQLLTRAVQQVARTDPPGTSLDNPSTQGE
jgi:hypothetical protein